MLSRICLIGTLLAAHVPALDAEMVGTTASGPGEYLGWIEKAGTVGVCIWMLVWFQKRNDQQNERLSSLTERALTALERNAESDRALAISIDGLKDVVQSCGRR